MLSLISCGIFRFELEHVLGEIEAELGREVRAAFLPPALDAHPDRLEQAVTERLEADGGETMLLYGSMCHPDWARITGKSLAPYPKAANCAEVLLSPEKKRELDAEGNAYFLTMGGLRLWKEIYEQGHGWDATDARINFGGFDKIIVLDTGVFDITDEELFEFFEFTQVPVEVMKISLDYFKSLVLGLCRKRLEAAE
jgi:hypothetical protein